MKKIILCLALVLSLLGCQVEDNTIYWVMLCKTEVDDMDLYSYFYDEVYTLPSELEEVKEIENVLEIKPLYKFDPNYYREDSTPSPTTITLYKDNEPIHQMYSGFENQENFGAFDIWGYPEELDMTAHCIDVYEEEVSIPCFIHEFEAKALGLTSLDAHYQLEIDNLAIPVSNSIYDQYLDDSSIFKVSYDNKHMFTSLHVTFDIKGILTKEIDNTQGQFYVPLEWMYTCLKEHQIEPVDTYNYLLKVKDRDTLDKVKEIDDNFRIVSYPVYND